MISSPWPMRCRVDNNSGEINGDIPINMMMLLYLFCSIFLTGQDRHGIAAEDHISMDRFAGQVIEGIPGEGNCLGSALMVDDEIDGFSIWPRTGADLHPGR